MPPDLLNRTWEDGEEVADDVWGERAQLHILQPGSNRVCPILLAPPALAAGCAAMPRCGCCTCRYCSAGLSRVDVLERHFPTAPIGGKI